MQRQNKPGFLSVGDVVRRIARDLRIEEKQEDFEALRDWPAVVGKRIARHSSPLFIRGDVLYVQVEGSSWGQEIAFKKTDIVNKINTRFGSARVGDVRCRTGQ